MLIVITIYISLNVADVSLSESGHLVPYGLTPHTLHAEVFHVLSAGYGVFSKIAKSEDLPA
jgi:hypothetical protein